MSVRRSTTGRQLFFTVLKVVFLLLLAGCSTSNNEIQYTMHPQDGPRVRSGLENFITRHSSAYNGKLAVLVTNHSGTDFNLQHNIDLLRSRGILVAFVLVPEHGLYGFHNEYDRTSYHVDGDYDIVVYNLHHFNARSLRRMLTVADFVVYDIQDMGMRCYTYISSLKLVMDALNGTGKELVVCDRPNPLGFLGVDGSYLERGFYSRHVSSFPAPFMYGLTIGEAARYYRGEYAKKVNLKVVPLEQYRRDMNYHETMLPWIPPSPNLPAYKSSIVYSAVVYMEGINISIGRGTPNPFEYIGAPFINPQKFARDLSGLGFKAFRFRPVYFEPSLSHYRGRKCGGVQIFYTGGVFSPTETAYKIIRYLKKEYPMIHWFRHGSRYGVDNLAGTDKFRRAIDSGKDFVEYKKEISAGIETYRGKRRKYLLY